MKSLQNCFCNRSPIYFLISILFFSISSFAQVAPVSPPTTGFAIDGGLRSNTPTSLPPFAANQGDWYPGSGGTGTSVFNESGVPISPATTQTSGRANPTDPFNGGDDVFSNGSKFNDYIADLRWTTNSAPDKNDINNALYHIARDPSNNNQWAFMAGDRLSTNGTSYIDFEFLQGTAAKKMDGTGTFSSTPAAGKPNGGGRTENDMLISMEYTNGGTKPLVYVYQWKLSGSTWSYQLATIANLETNAFAETNRTGAENNLPFTAFGNTFYQQYAFVEAAVNITFLLEQTGLACGGLSIKTLWVKTKAAASSTAALKDFMAPIPVDLNFGSTQIDNPGPFCASDNTAYTLSAQPTGAGATFTVDGNSATTFTPSSAGSGNHTIGYSYSGCTASATFVVNPSATANAGGPYSMCASGTSIELVGTYGGGATDGSWSGGAGSFGTSTKNATNKTITVSYTPTALEKSNGSVQLTFTTDNPAGPCNAVSANVTITFSANPSAPAACVILPSLCSDGVTTGAVLFTPLSAGTKYSIDNGAHWKLDCPVFSGLNPGAVTGLKVKDANGCVSAATNCSSIQQCSSNSFTNCNPDPSLTTSRLATNPYQPTEEQPSVLAYPNPFSDKVKFVITSSIKGKGILEVYDMLGQKVKTVYQGNMTTGSQTFELSLPRQNLGNLIYVLRIGDKRVSGKLLQIKQ